MHTKVDAKVMKNNANESKKEFASKQKEFEKAERRISEIDTLFKRTYEDNVSGKLADERFTMLSQDYDEEQKELKIRANELGKEIKEQNEKHIDIGNFLTLVKKYTEIQELSYEILREFIDKIVIHERDKSSGKCQQKIDIYYNFVGMLQA